MRRLFCLSFAVTAFVMTSVPVTASPAFTHSLAPISLEAPAGPLNAAPQAGVALSGPNGEVQQAPHWTPRTTRLRTSTESHRGTYTVTSCASSGPGTLADAISTANSSGGGLFITFDPSLSGCVIEPIGPLPILTSTNVTIDGDLNDDGIPDITVDGSSAGPQEEGIFLGGCVGVTVRGLRVRDFYLGFAGVAGGSNNIVDCVASNNAWGVIFAQSSNNLVIRTNATQNSITGIQFQEASSGNTVTDCLVDGNSGIGMVAVVSANSTTFGPDNVIVGNSSTGIAVQALTGTQIHGNYIGLLPDGTAVANLSDGIGLAISVFSTDIYDNVISGNLNSGVLVSETGSQNNVIRDNLIGVDPTGTSARANGTFGVAVAEESMSTTVGPNNVISGNLQAGVFVAGPSSNNVVENNIIGLDSSGLLPVPNGLVGVIFQSGTSANTLGPNNLIAANSTHGVLIVSAGTTVEVLDGRIGATGDGTEEPNVGHGLFVADEAIATVTGDLHVNSGTLFATARVEADARLEVSGASARVTLGGETPLGRAGRSSDIVETGRAGSTERTVTTEGAKATAGSAPVIDLLAASVTHVRGVLELSGGTVQADAVTIQTGPNEDTSGRLQGGGVVEAGLVTNDGIVSIDGDFVSAGASWDAQLWITGEYEQGAAGVLEASLKPEMVRGGGLPQSTALLLQDVVFTNASFAGTCRYIQNGITPALNDVYNVVVYEENTGVHDIVQGTVVDSNDDLWISTVHEENDGNSQSLAAILLAAPMLRNGSSLSGETGSGEQLTVVTHGTFSDAEGWVQDIADGMSDGLHPTNVNWDVTSFDWSGFSSQQPINTAEIAYQFGRSFAHWLIESELLYDSVHLLGHSSGAWFPDGFSDVWRARNPAGWTHLTGWDAFNPVLLNAPGLPNPAWGDNADFAAHYFNADVVAGTNSVFENAMNFNVTNQFILPWEIGALHGWPYEWYLLSIESADSPSPSSLFFGFALSFEYSAERPQYQLYLQPGELMAIPDLFLPFSPEPGGVYTVEDPVWQPPLDFAGLTLVPGPEGSVVVNPDGSLSLTTGPSGSVFVEADIDLLDDVNLYRSGVSFASAESGSLSIMVSDTTLVLVADEPAINAEADSTGTGVFRWLDTLPAGSQTVRWSLDARDGGTSSVTLFDFQIGLEAYQVAASVSWPDEVTYEGEPAQAFAVSAASPNPFQRETSLTLDLPREGSVTARVFDVEGGLVATLVDGILPAGRFTVNWDGTSNGGRTVSPGVYFYRVESETGASTGRIVRVR